MWWVDWRICDPPHKITHTKKYSILINSIKTNGWRDDAPILYGYMIDDRIQLITGSHRWAACKQLNKKIPVQVFCEDEIKRIWGTDTWVEWIKNPPLILDFKSSKIYR